MAHLSENEILDFVDKNEQSMPTEIFMAHINTCKPCRQLYESFVLLETNFGPLNIEVPSLSFTENVLTKWETLSVAHITKAKNINATLPYWFMGIIVTLGIACAGLIIFLFPHLGPGDRKVINILASLIQNKSLLNFIIYTNAILILWVFNTRVLSPYFKTRVSLA